MEDILDKTIGGDGGSDKANDKDNDGVGKTYSEKEFQSEVDKRVTAALETARAKWQSEYEKKLKAEKDEAARLAKLTADERAQEEFNKRVKEFEDRESKHNAEKLEFECTKQLAAQNLPIEFAHMLTGADAETTKNNIDAFGKLFSEKIDSAVTDRLKGKPPKTGDSGSDSFLENVRKGAGLK